MVLKANDLPDFLPVEALKHCKNDFKCQITDTKITGMAL